LQFYFEVANRPQERCEKTGAKSSLLTEDSESFTIRISAQISLGHTWLRAGSRLLSIRCRASASVRRWCAWLGQTGSDWNDCRNWSPCHSKWSGELDL